MTAEDSFAHRIVAGADSIIEVIAFNCAGDKRHGEALLQWAADAFSKGWKLLSRDESEEEDLDSAVEFLKERVRKRIREIEAAERGTA